MPNPKPTEEDRKNYGRPIKDSPFYHHPEEFLKVGDRVRAKFRVWDMPNHAYEEWGWVSAEAGELGTVVDTGCATCVTDSEVERLCGTTYQDGPVTRECQRAAGHTQLCDVVEQVLGPKEVAETFTSPQGLEGCEKCRGKVPDGTKCKGCALEGWPT